MDYLSIKDINDIEMYAEYNHLQNEIDHMFNIVENRYQLFKESRGKGVIAGIISGVLKMIKYIIKLFKKIIHKITGGKLFGKGSSSSSGGLSFGGVVDSVSNGVDAATSSTRSNGYAGNIAIFGEKVNNEFKSIIETAHSNLNMVTFNEEHFNVLKTMKDNIELGKLEERLIKRFKKHTAKDFRENKSISDAMKSLKSNNFQLSGYDDVFGDNIVMSLIKKDIGKQLGDKVSTIKTVVDKCYDASIIGVGWKSVYSKITTIMEDHIYKKDNKGFYSYLNRDYYQLVISSKDIKMGSNSMNDIINLFKKVSTKSQDIKGLLDKHIDDKKKDNDNEMGTKTKVRFKAKTSKITKKLDSTIDNLEFMSKDVRDNMKSAKNRNRRMFDVKPNGYGKLIQDGEMKNIIDWIDDIDGNFKKFDNNKVFKSTVDGLDKLFNNLYVKFKDKSSDISKAMKKSTEKIESIEKTLGDNSDLVDRNGNDIIKGVDVVMKYSRCFLDYVSLISDLSRLQVLNMLMQQHIKRDVKFCLVFRFIMDILLSYDYTKNDNYTDEVKEALGE